MSSSIQIEEAQTELTTRLTDDELRRVLADYGKRLEERQTSVIEAENKFQTHQGTSLEKRALGLQSTTQVMQWIEQTSRDSETFKEILVAQGLSAAYLRSMRDSLVRFGDPDLLEWLGAVIDAERQLATLVDQTCDAFGQLVANIEWQHDYAQRL